MKSRGESRGDGKAIAVDTAAANEQHYEVPTEFYLGFLGPCMKYSSCEWELNNPNDTLEAAEERTLASYARRVGLDDDGVKRVLDIGCGWGSFTLWAAKKYPQLSFTCFSNSATQIAHITQSAKERGLSNVRATRLDINKLSLQNLGETKPFDRIVSIECLEHSENYELLFERIASLMTPAGKFFCQILGHREYTYKMDSETSWMARNFFTGGTIPSTRLFLHCNKHLCVDAQDVIPGTHYKKTLDTWLERMYANQQGLTKILGSGAAFTKWRMFHLLCAESFGLREGKEYLVAYYTFSRRK
uniref:Cyclopropane-fatty-acyl-phospholipid synthase n=1 Tax=Oxyrrhis marina TaxID=2969 RepID=A0A7S3UJB0_OXYMA